MRTKIVKIFLDSNVILSGFISYKGAPSILLDLLSLDLPFLKGCTGKYNIIEIQRNIQKKVPEILEIYQKYFPKLNLEIIPLPEKKEVKKYSGITSGKDIPVLLSAEKCSADFLVTSDKDLIKTKVKQDFQFEIISPSDCLEKIMGELF